MSDSLEETTSLPPINIEEERGRTQEALAEVLQFLSHFDYPSRRELARELRQQADLVETEFETERSINTIPGE